MQQNPSRGGRRVAREAAWGALFGALVALVEAHATFVTTGRFHAAFAVANLVYLAGGFAAGGAILGMLRGLHPRHSRRGAVALRLGALLAVLLFLRTSADGLFGVLRGAGPSVEWAALRAGGIALAGAALLLAACLRTARASAFARPARQLLALLLGAGAIVYGSAVVPALTLERIGPLASFVLLVAGVVLASWSGVRSARAPSLRLAVPAVCLALVGAVGVRLLAGPPSFSRTSRLADPPRVAAPPDAPNVVLVVLDTVRADHLELYGYHRETMPELASFARDGVVYEHCMASSSWTLPSHASLFTGRHPREHGAHGGAADSDAPGRAGARPLADGATTVAEALGAKGYRTAGVGANWLFLRPEYGLGAGFEHWDVRPSYRGAMLQGYTSLLARLRTPVDALPIRWLYEPLIRLDLAQVIYRRAETITDRALEQVARLEGRERPFFLFLNYMDAHDPYLAPGRFADHFPGRSPHLPRQWRGLARAKPPRAVLLEHVRAQYDSELRYLDFHLGRLFRALERSGRLEDTIVIVTSDHGEALGDHGNQKHGFSLYQEEVHVPLVVRDPHGERQLRVEAPVDLAAVKPWLLRRLRLPANARSATPIGVAEGDRAAFAELYGVTAEGASASAVDRLAVRLGAAKLIESSDGRRRLFDLSSDPHERAASSLRDSETAGALAAIRRRWAREARSSESSRSGPPTLSLAEIQRLRAVGYIH